VRPVKYHLVDLPCKPAIKKYITAVFGSPVFASNKTIIGLQITASLSKERYTDRKKYIAESQEDDSFNEFFLRPVYTEKLQVRVSQWQFDRLGFDFSDEKIIELNQFMECLLEEHMCMWVSARMTPGAERKKLIEDFCALHNISLDIEDGDIALETLIKTEYRKRKHLARHNTRPFTLRSHGRPESDSRRA